MDENKQPAASAQKPDLNQLLAEKRERLKILEGEFGQLGQSLDEEFYSDLANQLTPEELELRFDDDPTAFAKAIEAKKEAFKAERLGASEEELNALRQEVGALNDQSEIEAARQEFLSAHPEVNLDELNAYVKEGNLTGKQLAELNAQPDYLSAFEYVYGAMTGGASKTAADKAPALPPSQDLGAGGAPSEVAPVEDEYLKALGVR
ncbi:MAG: hypothetical protein LBF86_03715 [Helicobacteraceae bacterium]|jgi:hypothetical protein|nr:hypothetical protein [Helicobacteraceae bacterium]